MLLTRQSGLRIFLAVSLSVATFLLFFPFAIRGVDAHHDGYMLKPALDVWSGQTLFVNTYNQYGSLNSYLQAGFLWMFGPTLFSLKVATVAVYGLSLLLLFWSWQSILPLGLAVLSVVLWWAVAPFYRFAWALLPWSSSYALFFQSATSVLLLASLRSQRARKSAGFALLAGVTAALTLWCRLPVGVLLTVAIACVLAWLRSRDRLLGFIAGFVATNAGFFSDLQLHGSTSAWYQQVILEPRKWVGTQEWDGLTSIVVCLFPDSFEGSKLAFGIGSAILLQLVLDKAPAFTAKKWSRAAAWVAWAALVWVSVAVAKHSPDPVTAWFSLMPMALAVAGVWFVVGDGQGRSTAEPEQLVVVSLIAVSIASWAQFYPVTCYRHMFWAASPMIGPFVYLVFRGLGKRTWLAATVLIVLVAPLVADRITVARDNLDTPRFRMQGPEVLRGMWVTREQETQISPLFHALDGYFRKHGTRPIVFDGRDPLYETFTSDLRNPGPYTVGTNYVDVNTEAVRRQFISKTQAVILLQERPETGAEGAQRFRELGYETLLKTTHFEILVPEEGRRPTRADQAH